MKTLDIKLIEPNPFRHFDLYPIDDVQVERLMHSIQDEGFWLGLQVRKHPTKDGKYQLAFGHHRLAAAKKAGMKEITAEVVKIDDASMVKRMVVENSTQHGNNAGASIDSVAAIVSELAYILSRHDWEKTFVAIVTNPQAAKSIKGNFDAGKGIGKDAILTFAPEGTLDLREVTTALGVLKDGGRYDELVEDARNRASIYNAKHGPKVEEVLTKTVAAPRPKKEKTFDDRVSHVFKNAHQLDTFRKAVTDEYAARYVPVSKQLDLATSIAKDAEKRKGEITAKGIKESVHQLVMNAIGHSKKAEKEDDEAYLDKQALLSKRVNTALEQLRGAAFHWSKGSTALHVATQEGAILNDTQLRKLRDYIETINTCIKSTSKDIGSKL